MTKENDKFARLAAPFSSDVIEWRVQRAGTKTQYGTGDVTQWASVLAYIDNRAIMNRLDRVIGAENWRNEYKEAPGGGVLCGISIRFGDEWVTKWDGADNTAIEATKGGLSNSMKRAAVQWGIGRYLYRLESKFVNVLEKPAFDKISDSTKDKYIKLYQKANPTKKIPKVEGWWKPPMLPEWARPQKTSQEVTD